MQSVLTKAILSPCFLAQLMMNSPNDANGGTTISGTELFTIYLLSDIVNYVCIQNAVQQLTLIPHKFSPIGLI